MSNLINYGRFEWDEQKNLYNQDVHNLSFENAVQAFLDDRRIIAKDEQHSQNEDRLFCIGRVYGKVATVRFTMRGDSIRIIGAGYWRKGAKLYEEENR